MVFGWNKAVVQVLYVGMLAFCCPGMFNALTGLGGAGTDDHTISAAANAALYGTFVIFGYFGGACFNIFGNKILMFVGGFGYCVYAICSYLAGEYTKLKFLTVLGGAFLGCCAGWFWTAQGAMMMAYASPNVRGKYISYFWIVFNLGATVGGILMFGINFNSTADSAGKANPASYFTIVALMAIGGAGSLFLAKPETVEREDNEPVHFEKAKSVCQEFKDAIGVSTNKYMILLALPFFCSNWFYTYHFNGYNAVPFNIRTRGLNSAIYWAAQMVGAFFFGLLLDKRTISVKRRAWLGFAAVFTVFNIACILGALVQYKWHGGFERDAAPVPRWDVKESGIYWFPCIVYILYGASDSVIQTYSYWLMATIAGDNGTLCAQFAGFYKGVQSLGACISWLVDLKLKYKPQFWIQWGLLLLSFPLMASAAYLIDNAIAEHSPGHNAKEAPDAGLATPGVTAGGDENPSI